MKAVRQSIASNGVPYVQMRLAGSHSTSEKGKEGKKKGIGQRKRDTNCPWSHEVLQKIFKLVWRCDQLLSGFLANYHLPRVSCQSANKDDNKEAGGCAQISQNLNYDRGKPRKTSVRTSTDEDCATSYSLKWGPLHPNVGGRIAQHARKG